MRRPRTTGQYAAIGVGMLVGVVVALVVVVLFCAFGLCVGTLHRLSFTLCSLGFHDAGCWIRRVVTVPALLEMRAMTDKVEAWRRGLVNGLKKT